MPAAHEIRADYDRDTIAIYQAYSPAIADAALKASRFVSPFSFHRMTWIKPSFLWLMHRSHWGQKGGQERVLAVRIKRTGWERGLSLAVLTSFVPPSGSSLIFGRRILSYETPSYFVIQSRSLFAP